MKIIVGNYYFHRDQGAMALVVKIENERIYYNKIWKNQLPVPLSKTKTSFAWLYPRQATEIEILLYS